MARTFRSRKSISGETAMSTVANERGSSSDMMVRTPGPSTLQGRRMVMLSSGCFHR